MSDTKEQVLSFLDKCEEIKSCKFIMATTKIKDLLKCIVNCPALYRLFETVTNGFNYLEAKSQCLVTVNDGIFTRSYVVLPQTVGQRLAFIFCLLVEFDKDNINLNDFLRQYFPEDGSYFASYQAFCNTIIKGLQDCISQVFREEIAMIEEDAEKSSSQAGEISSALTASLSQEMDFISKSGIAQEEKENGLKMLTALAKNLKVGNVENVDALLCGYSYFVLNNKCVSEGIAELIELIEAFEKTL
ncbi:MAG: hypothetical protein K2K38_03685 [Clostridia bacterium]|nr:hypothetical protein [Clostridia bacterium]